MIGAVAAGWPSTGYRRDIDARTRERRAVSFRQRSLRLVSLSVFLLAVWQLDPIVRWLADPGRRVRDLPVLKRFTWISHLWLGAVDGLAPMGAWIAITGNLPLAAWLLGAAVACWVAGFDCFYALLDEDFDRREGLKSVATAFGERGAFWAARVLHIATVGLLIWVGVLLDVGVLLAGRHAVAASDLRARTRAARQPAAARHCVLPDERDHQRHVLRVRPSRFDFLSC
jgi:4-hydroxybenzoate polyprenyltransferase